jgi:UDP-N-acetylmuramate: L-alanyl-gamma-D-glutamyl-meso-diaminopimelate ligase
LGDFKVIKKISELKPGSHIHIMGICGTAMGNFAGLLKSMGYKITGSDQNVYPPMSDVLKNLNIEVFTGYKKENLIPAPDFVVVGNVISKTMPEAEYLLTTNIPYASFPESIGDMILKNTHSIAVCGTHGKTTTTSMQAWIAECHRLMPGYLIGGVPKNFESSFSVGGGDYFVIEGDEYDTAFFDKVPKFTHYFPKSAILTSIEFDHADIYKDLNDVINAFKILFHKLSDDGNLVYHAGDENIKSLLSEAKTKNKFSYGFKNADFLIKNIDYSNDFTRWSVDYKNQTFHLKSTMGGEHNVLNFTANFALSLILGWDIPITIKAIESFLGVKRRQEILGEFNGTLLMEDFAHHPTAVKMTLQGLKSKYPNRRLVAVFEPRSATSRKSVFQEDYFHAFYKNCDQVVVAQPYLPPSSQTTSEQFSSQKLVNDLNAEGTAALLSNSYENIVKDIMGVTKANDLIVLMSNGGFGGIYPQMIEALKG